MSVKRGLKDFQDDLDGTGGKIRYMKLDDKQTVTVQFLDDLDDSPAVEAGAGKAALISEHKSPHNFKRKAQCTRDMESEGERCYACDKAIATPKSGWGRTKRLYVNVLVDDGKDEPYVAVWNMGVARNAAWDILLDEFLESGSIADTPWRVRRSGKDTATTYTIKRLEGGPADFAAFERYDLDEVTRLIPYDEQEAHYAGQVEAAPAEDATEEW